MAPFVSLHASLGAKRRLLDSRPFARVARFSRLYTRITSPVAYIARRFIRDSAFLVGGRSEVCVDVGAGTAPYRADLVQAFGVKHYVAIDVAPTDVTSVVSDGLSLPLASASAGLVVSFDVIQHVREPERFVAELARVVSPTGYVMLTFPFLYCECDFADYERWTIAGMNEMLARHGLKSILSRRRGGILFAWACAMNWVIQHALPGQRKFWRSDRNWRTLLRSLLVVALSIPTTVVAWLALWIDSLLPVHGSYMGGAVFARRIVTEAGTEEREPTKRGRESL